jgi:hypothetical protein
MSNPDIKDDSMVNQIESVEDEKHRAHRGDDASSIRSEALGDDLPPGYFYSPQFIGAIAVSLEASTR